MEGKLKEMESKTKIMKKRKFDSEEDINSNVLLFELVPIDIIGSMILPYLDLQDTRQLDTSVTSRRYRSQYLLTYKHMNIIKKEDLAMKNQAGKYFTITSISTWLLNRNIKLEFIDFRLPATKGLFDTLQYLALFGNHVNEICLTLSRRGEQDSNPFPIHVFCFLVNLKTLELRGNISNIMKGNVEQLIGMFCCGLINFKSIDICGASSNNSLQLIAAQFPNLNSFCIRAAEDQYDLEIVTNELINKIGTNGHLTCLELSLQRYQEFPLSSLKRLLQRNKHIEVLNFHRRYSLNWIPTSFLDIISLYCPALKETNVLTYFKYEDMEDGDKIETLSKSCPLLKSHSVKISSTKINDAVAIKILEHFSLLNGSLSCCGNITDALFESLSHYKGNILNLDGTRITNRGLEIILVRFTHLNELSLGETNIGLGEAFMNENISLIQLRKLKVFRTDICYSSIESILCKAINLEDLNLDSCSSLNGESFINLNRDVPSIKKLILSNTYISDEEVHNILRRFVNLEYLNIRGCSSLTSSLFKDLDCIFNNLKVVNAINTSISKASVISLCKAAPFLKEFNVAVCENIDQDDIINELKKLFPTVIFKQP